MVDLLTEQVRILDPDSNALYIPTESIPASASRDSHHELVHALQHQYLNLDSLVELSARTNRRHGGASVLEGQATLAQILVLMPEQKIESLPNFWTCERPWGAQQDQMKCSGAHRCGCGEPDLPVPGRGRIRALV